MTTVLITGCSSGYGLATAHHLHDQGFRVIATMRTPREDLLPPSVTVLPLDDEQRGLIAGVSDPMLAPALDQLHADIAHGWTVEELARVAAVSRAEFTQRFSQVLGIPPMRYPTAWRVALAKDLLTTERLSAEQAAHRVGYSSAAAFTVAFTRVAGASPSAFLRRTAG